MPALPIPEKSGRKFRRTETYSLLMDLNGSFLRIDYSDIRIVSGYYAIGAMPWVREFTPDSDADRFSCQTEPCNGSGPCELTLQPGVLN